MRTRETKGSLTATSVIATSGTSEPVGIKYPNLSGIVIATNIDGSAELFTNMYVEDQTDTIYHVKQVLGYGDHFYTASPGERDDAVAQFGYHVEGVAFYAYESQQPNTEPVWRLLNSDNGDHFYTISAGERDNAVAQFGYHVEGVVFNAYESQQPNTGPVWRLLKTTDSIQVTSMPGGPTSTRM